MLNKDEGLLAELKSLVEEYNRLYDKEKILVGIELNSAQIELEHFKKLAREQIINVGWNGKYLELSITIEDLRIFCLI